MGVFRRASRSLLLGVVALSLSVPAVEAQPATHQQDSPTSTSASDNGYVVSADNGDRLTVSPTRHKNTSTKNGASPLLVTSSFDWTADIKFQVRSRRWTLVRSGDVTISSYGSCPVGATTNKYSITLYRDNTSQGRANYTCGSTLQYTWSSRSAGNYSFIIQKVNDTIERHFEGTVYYP